MITKTEPVTPQKLSGSASVEGIPKQAPKQGALPLITAITNRFIQHLQPDKVILFGSQANNTAIPGSDIDLFIIVNDLHALAKLKRWERFGKLLHLFPYRSFGLDAIILTQAEVQHLQNVNEGEWDLVLEILKKGKILYERTKHTQAE